jgi:haloalkane dehalogenase
LIGFGRSDKPLASNAYSIRSHVRWLRAFIRALDLSRITMIGHDWGGGLGMRVLAEMPERFVRLVAMNTGISPGGLLGDAFRQWRRFSQRVNFMDVARVISRTLKSRRLNEAEATAYNAPFPGPEYQMAALTFPRLVPSRPDSPGAYDNRVAIEKLKTLTLPVLLLWGADDAVTAPAEPVLRAIFRNVAPPLAIENAGHFIQEDAGAEVAERILEWLGRR